MGRSHHADAESVNRGLTSDAPARKFRWRGLDRHDRRQFGRAMALNEASLIHRLGQAGLHSIEITPIKPFGVWHAALTHQDFTTWLRQLAALSGAGIDILDALELSQRQSAPAPLRRMLQSLISDVRAGKSLSHAMESLDAPLDSAFVAGIRSAEHSGHMADALHLLAMQAERTQTIRATLKSAMMYPIAVLVIALTAWVAMLIWIVPAFEVQFQNWKVPLPTVTQSLLWISRQVTSHAWVIISATLLIGLAIRRIFMKSVRLQSAWHWIALRLPVVGPLRRQLCVARFAATLALLLQTGVALLDAVKVAGESTGNIEYEKHAHFVEHQLIAGVYLSQALHATGGFPEALIHMCRVGEQTGQTGHLLRQIADMLDHETQLQIRGLTTLVEPIMVTILGSLIGAMVMALYLPIFRLGDLL